jgi:hypothetical protein
MMRPGTAGLFCQAIYFASSEASARSKYGHHDHPGLDIVIVAVVDLGRALVVEGTEYKAKNHTTLNGYGCNSLIGRSNPRANWESVVSESWRVTV